MPVEVIEVLCTEEDKSIMISTEDGLLIEIGRFVLPDDPAFKWPIGERPVIWDKGHREHCFAAKQRINDFESLIRENTYPVQERLVEWHPTPKRNQMSDFSFVSDRVIDKHPLEKLGVKMFFPSNIVSASNPITEVVSFVHADQLIISNHTITDNGTTVTMIVEGGVSNLQHSLQVLVKLADEQEIIMEGRLRVSDVPNLS